MFGIFKKNISKEKIKIINKYRNPFLIKDLILEVFDRKGKTDDAVKKEVYEDNFMKVIYSHPDSYNYTYLIYVKDGEELIEVFNRVTTYSSVEVKNFVISDWIYNLYLVTENRIVQENIIEVIKHNKLPRITNDTRFKKIENE